MSFPAHTQLLMRQLDWLPQSRLLLVNPPADQSRSLKNEGFSVFSWHLYANSAWQQQIGEQLTPFLDQCPEVDGVIINVTKEKQLTLMMMANLAALLPVNTPVLLVGHKDSGIQSYGKLQFSGYSATEKLASGNHCQLMRCALTTPQPFSADTFLSAYPLADEYGAIQVFNYPGVFSHNRLDGGSALLLNALMQQPQKHFSGRVLDFACGSGVIAAALHQYSQPTHLTGIDVNTLALAAAAKTWQQLNVEHELIASDGLSVLSKRTPTPQFDCIVTNPPFHTGKQTDYQITQDFIRDCRQYLRPGGHLYLVANSFLPYREVLQQTFRQVNVLVDNRKFTVWHAH
ncbi:MAG: methyltransferase [Gammaproteobacteria bacterium]|nr:methyltransferase [Gammaproteobacteria bacterium]